MRPRRLLRWPYVLSALVLLLGAIVAGSWYAVETWGPLVARERVEQALAQALGRPVRIERLSFEPWLGRLVARRAAVAAGPRWEDGALLELGRVEVRVGISSLWRREIVLSRVLLEDADLRVRGPAESRGDGPSAPPLIPDRIEAGPVVIQIRLVELRRGRVTYRDVSADREVRVEGLDIAVRPAPDRMEVTVRARELGLEMPGLREVATRLEARAVVARERLSLDRVSLVWQGRPLELRGSVLQPFAEPALDLRLHGEVDLASLRQRARVPWPVRGIAQAEVEATGSLPELRATLRATVPSLEAAGVRARDVALEARWAQGALEVSALRAQAFGGRVAGSLLARPDRLDLTRLKLQLTDVALGALGAAAGGAAAGAGGRLDLEADLQGDPARLLATRGSARLTARALRLPAGLAGPGTAAVEIPTLAAAATWADGLARVERLEARALGGRIEGSASARLAAPHSGRLAVRLQDLALDELDRLAGAALGLRGRLDLEADLQGDPRRPLGSRGELAVRARGVEVGGALARAGTGTMRLRARVGNGAADLLEAEARWPGIRIAAGGQLREEGPRPLRVEATAELDAVGRIAQQPIPSGRASLKAVVTGTWTEPDVTGRLVVPSLELGGGDLEGVDISVRLSGRTLEVDPASMRLGRSRVRASARASWEREPAEARFVVSLAAPTLELEDLAPWVPAPWRGSGAVTLRAKAEGTRERWSGTAQVGGARLVGPHGIRVRDLAASLGLAHDRIDVTALTATVEDAPVRVDGHWALDGTGRARAEIGPLPIARVPGLPPGLRLEGTATAAVTAAAPAPGALEASARVRAEGLAAGGIPIGPAGVDATLDRSDLTARLELPERRLTVTARGRLGAGGVVAVDARLLDLELGPLLRAAWPDRPVDLGGRLSAAAALRVPAADPRAVTGTLRLDPVRLDIAGEAWQARGPVVLSRAAGRTRLEQLELAGPSGTVRGSGHVEDAGAIQAAVAGRFPLAILPRLRPEIADARGVLELDAAIAGTTAAPELLGQGTISGGEVALAAYPAVIRSISGRFTLTPEAFRLAELRGALGRGSIRAAGDVVLDGRAVGLFQIRLTARDVALAPLEGLDTEWDADLEVVGRPTRSQVRGEARLLRGRYTRELALLPMLLARPSGPAAPGAGASVGLNVVVKLQDNMLVRTSIAQLRAGGTLRLQGSLADPIVFGAFEAREGSVTFRRNRFELQSLSARFADPRKIDPILNVRGTTQIRDYAVTLQLAGRAEDLTVRLSSTPPLPQEDLLSLVTLGVTRSELERSAGTVVAGEAARLLVEEVLGIRGGPGFLDVFEVEAPGAEGGSVMAGKRLGERTTIIYTGSLTDGREQKLRVEYQLLGPVLLSGEQDFRGGYGADVVIRLRFR